MYDHLIRANEAESRIEIYRVYFDGREELFTYLCIPKITFDSDKAGFERIAQRLGEDVFIDSPVFRRIFKI